MTSMQTYSDGVLIEQWSLGGDTDPQPAGFTRYDADGEQVEHRPLTDDEAAALNPAPAEPTEDQRIDALVAAAAQQQAQLDELTDLLLFGGE